MERKVGRGSCLVASLADSEIVQTRSLALHDVAEVRGTRFAKVIVVIEMDSPWMLSRWSTLPSTLLKKKPGSGTNLWIGMNLVFTRALRLLKNSLAVPFW